MKKRLKRGLSILLCVVMITTNVLPSFANGVEPEAETTKVIEVENYEASEGVEEKYEEDIDLEDSSEEEQEEEQEEEVKDDVLEEDVPNEDEEDALEEDNLNEEEPEEDALSKDESNEEVLSEDESNEEVLSEDESNEDTLDEEEKLEEGLKEEELSDDKIEEETSIEETNDGTLGETFDEKVEETEETTESNIDETNGISVEEALKGETTVNDNEKVLEEVATASVVTEENVKENEFEEEKNIATASEVTEEDIDEVEVVATASEVNEEDEIATKSELSLKSGFKLNNLGAGSGTIWYWCEGTTLHLANAKLTDDYVERANNIKISAVSNTYKACTKIIFETDCVFGPCNDVGEVLTFSYMEKLVTIENIERADFSSPDIKSFRQFFSFCTSLEDIDLRGLKVSPELTSVAGWFHGCNKLKNVVLPDMSNCNKIKDFHCMFGANEEGGNECGSLKTVDFNGLHGDPTAPSIDFCRVFKMDNSLEEMDLSDVLRDCKNILAVGTFLECPQLKVVKLPEAPAAFSCLFAMFDHSPKIERVTIPGISNATSECFLNTFQGCTGLVEVDLSNNIDVPHSISDAECMFNGCTSLTTIKGGQCFFKNGFSAANMFRLCSHLVGGEGTVFNSSNSYPKYARPDRGTAAPGYFTDTTNHDDFVCWYVETSGSKKIIHFSSSCYGYQTCKGPIEFVETEVDGEIVYKNPVWDNGPFDKVVIDDEIKLKNCATYFFSGMSGANNITEISGLENLNLSECTNIQGMFEGCAKLESIDLSGLNLSNIKKATGLFKDCAKLASVDYGTNTLANNEYFDEMYSGCEVLTSADDAGVASLNMAKAKTLKEMFLDCKGLASFSAAAMTLTNCSSMENAFKGCEELASFSVSSWNVANVKNMSGLFDGCSKLDTISVPNWSTTSLENTSNMFSGVELIDTLDLSTMKLSSSANATGMLSGCAKLNTVKISATLSSKMSDTSLDGSWKNTSSNLTYPESGGVNTIPAIAGTYVRVCTVTFETNGGSEIAPQGVIKGETIDLTPFVPTKTDSDFLGWYEDSGFVTECTNPMEVNTDVTVYAKWKQLIKIEVATPPDKVLYDKGENFDPTGLEIKFVYDVGGTEETETVAYASDKFTLTPGVTTALAVTNTEVTIKENGKGKTCEQPITVRDIESIEVDTVPTKVIYVKGEYFDPTGMKIKINWTNGDEEVVDYTSDKFTLTPNTTTALTDSTTGITIKEKTSSKTCVQSITMKQITSIEVDTAPTKVIYVKGEYFDPTGMKVKINWTNGDEDVVDYTSDKFTLSPTTTTALPATATKVIVKERTSGKTCDQPITIRQISSIEVDTPPTKTLYNKGEKFDPTGMKIKINYNAGDPLTEVVDYSTRFTLTPAVTVALNTSHTGVIIKDTTSSKTCTQPIVVREIVRIEQGTEPTQTEYYQGDNLNPAGLGVKVVWSNGDEEIIPYDSDKFTLTPNTSAVLAPTNTKVVVKDNTSGKTYEQPITVHKITSIEVATPPTDITYREGEPFDPAGLKIKIVFDDGTEREVNYADVADRFTLTPSAGAAITKSNIPIKIKDNLSGQTVTQDINIVGLTIVTPPDRVNYAPGDTFDPTGLTFKYVKDDGTIEMLDYDASIFDLQPNGSALYTSNKNIKIVHKASGENCSQKITVKVTSYPVMSSGGGGGGGGGGDGSTVAARSSTGFVNGRGITNTQFQANSVLPLVTTSVKSLDYGKYTWVRNNDSTWNLYNGDQKVSNCYMYVTRKDEKSGLYETNLFHFDQKGTMTVGWHKNEAGQYYFFEDIRDNNEGRLCLGHTKMYDDNVYYFNRDGSMYTGWLRLSDGTYQYFLPDGRECYGWVKLPDGTWRYFDGYGTLQVNCTTPDGYKVDENGVWIVNA